MVRWQITAETPQYTQEQKLERLEKAVSKVDIATQIINEYISMNFDADIAKIWDDVYSKIRLYVRFRVEDYYGHLYCIIDIEPIIKRVQEEYIKELSSSLYQLLMGVETLEELSRIKTSPKFKNIQKRCREFDNLAIEIRKKACEEEDEARRKRKETIERKEKIERLKAIVTLIGILLTFLWLFSQ